MAYTLRLPPDLFDRASAHAETLGLPLSRFIALVLTDHFQRMGDAAPALAIVPSAPAAAVRAAPAPKGYPAKAAHKKRR